MISKIKLLKNIGQFHSVSTGANMTLLKLSLVYSENGRGKTTIAAILRSLSTGDPVPIMERRKLSSPEPPLIVLECDGQPPDIVYSNDAWSQTIPSIAIFDDVFIDRNVCSGLEIGAEHRQNLHEWILRAQGVEINDRLELLVSKREEYTSNLNQLAGEIPQNELHGFSVDDFCSLQERPEIDDEILSAERNLAAVNEQESIRITQPFDILNLPAIDLASVESMLNANLDSLDTASVARVQEHLAKLGRAGEVWVDQGMELIEVANTQVGSVTCPFCAQDLAGSPVMDHYRSYFSEQYNNLKKSLSDTVQEFELTHGDEAQVAFERAVFATAQRGRFWESFCDIPTISVDTAAIDHARREAREIIAKILTAKQSAPLEQMELTDEIRLAVGRYEGERKAISTLNIELQEANAAILAAKAHAEEGNPTLIAADLERLMAVKARYSPEIKELCAEILFVKGKKADTEGQIGRTRVELNDCRTNTFWGYADAINEYIAKFNAGFRLTDVNPTYNRGGSACTYGAIIDNTPVQISVGSTAEGEPSFGNTLSSGDRNTLALAFFFASLDRGPELSNKVVVIDDPISSLDENRSHATTQEIQNLAERVDQVIVLSHNKTFLGRLWDATDPTLRSAFELSRSGETSTLRVWNVEEDRLTEHDRLHALLHEYLRSGVSDSREVAKGIRTLLDGYLRVVYPVEFPPGSMIGTFLHKCRERVTSQDQILNETEIQELSNINEYARKFHHDGSAAWEPGTINESELTGYVGRALNFASPAR